MAVARKKPTLIEEVRRKQIVETAIETIAARGFSQTTLGEIARTAGVSTGVITYHFKNKDELIEQCIKRLFEVPNNFVVERVESQRRYADRLRTFIEANIEFMLRNRSHSAALVHSFGALNSEKERKRIMALQHTKIRNFLVRILEGGQSRKEFREFPTQTIAQLVLGTLEGIMIQWILDEKEIDLPLCAEELVEMVNRRVLADPA